MCCPGAFRIGKSFLLDFFLRYLTLGGKEDWISSDEEPLTGFKMGGESLITRYLEELNKEIDEL